MNHRKEEEKYLAAKAKLQLLESKNTIKEYQNGGQAQKKKPDEMGVYK